MIRSSPQDVMARLERDHVQDETSSRSSLLFEHDLFRKTGTHFSGSCSTAPAIQRPSSSVLFEHDLFRKTGTHFSGSCSIESWRFSCKTSKDARHLVEST